MSKGQFNHHVGHQKKSTSNIELAELIVDMINEQPFFKRNELIPKVSAILKGFSVNLNQTKYNRIETPTRMAKATRAAEQKEAEQKYWFQLAKTILSPEEIKRHVEQCNDHLKKLGF